MFVLFFEHDFFLNENTVNEVKNIAFFPRYMCISIFRMPLSICNFVFVILYIDHPRQLDYQTLKITWLSDSRSSLILHNTL